MFLAAKNFTVYLQSAFEDMLTQDSYFDKIL